jgi:hypothetical protein
VSEGKIAVPFETNSADVGRREYGSSKVLQSSW